MPDTIVALATPTGRSGIGVVRLSGPLSLAITRKLVADEAYDPEPRTAHLKQLFEPSSGELIDEAIVTYFQAPHSFSGEDIVEISCHGSPVLLRQVIDVCLTLDARIADPGEYSLRALANGRINLAQAEAIRDLIDAQTTASARQAIRQMRGELSMALQPMKDDLLDVIVVLESALEFVEDDLPDFQTKSIRTRLVMITDSLEKIASTFKAGQLIREGLRVAIVGRPNVGKSSVFNALVGSDRAIVTDIAGTTRDQVHERFTVNDIPVSLIDTAGLRETKDTVESIGVERSKATMADADLVIAMVDASEDLNEVDLSIIRSVEQLRHLVAINKIDLVNQKRVDESADKLRSAKNRHAIIRVSAKTGEGVDGLRRAIIEPFAPEDVTISGFLITDARHHDLLLRAMSEIRQSLTHLQQKMSEEIILIGLHNALRYLGQITGETTTEDMLSRIFSTFCIGK